MAWWEIWKLYDYREGFWRTLKSEENLISKLPSKFKKIYLGLSFLIRVFLFITAFLFITYLISKNQLYLLETALFAFINVILCIIKQNMRKYYKQKFNIKST